MQVRNHNLDLFHLLSPSPTAWTLFAAATVTNSSVRDSLIGPVWNRANVSSYFPSVYELDSTTVTLSGTSR